jgi:3-hydroxyisobutyrate dehydrogenase-like beta-hydroxyacid dehydrogenase
MEMNIVADEPVGFIGLGSMGGSLANRMAEAGIPLCVFDIRSEASERFKDVARIAASPLDVANQARIIFACLPTLESNRAVVLGPDGIAGGTKVGLYVHTGTTGVEFTLELAQGLAAHGVQMIDAPVTGGPFRAKAGKLSVIASGPRALVDLAQPLMAAYSNKTIYMGEELGLAQMAKLVNNLLSVSNLALAAEALVVGKAAGLDPAVLVEVFNHGSGQNTATLNKLPDCILPRTFDFGSTMKIVEKDLTAFIDEATSHGVATPLAAAILDCYITAAERGSPDDDLTKVIRHMEIDAGIECRGPAAA